MQRQYTGGHCGNWSLDALPKDCYIQNTLKHSVGPMRHSRYAAPAMQANKASGKYTGSDPAWPPCPPNLPFRCVLRPQEQMNACFFQPQTPSAAYLLAAGLFFEWMGCCTLTWNSTQSSKSDFPRPGRKFNGPSGQAALFLPYLQSPSPTMDRKSEVGPNWTRKAKPLCPTGGVVRVFPPHLSACGKTSWTSRFETSQ